MNHGIRDMRVDSLISAERQYQRYGPECDSPQEADEDRGPRLPGSFIPAFIPFAAIGYPNTNFTISLAVVITYPESYSMNGRRFLPKKSLGAECSEIN